mmetsp:Transcript_49322/g.81893  ORF Transcript_49322/g.81893 Transcript_49322/m.81893 type:complete len:290 (-) Transcript_49322:86-955(-)
MASSVALTEDSHEHQDERVVSLPDELVNAIVLIGGWRSWCSWRAVSRRYLPIEWLMERVPVMVVPDVQPTINSGISHAWESNGSERVCFVRPGQYRESIRLTQNVVLIGLGIVRCCPPGWEPALVWGGFTAGAAVAGKLVYERLAAGESAVVHNLRLELRNMQQQTAVYITWGTPLITHCHIGGTVHVAGAGSMPTIRRCVIEGSRSCGIRIIDHARLCLEGCTVRNNRGAAIRVGRTTPPSLCSNGFHGVTFEGNGIDGVSLEENDDTEYDALPSFEDHAEPRGRECL